MSSDEWRANRTKISDCDNIERSTARSICAVITDAFFCSLIILSCFLAAENFVQYFFCFCVVLSCDESVMAGTNWFHAVMFVDDASSICFWHEIGQLRWNHNTTKSYSIKNWNRQTFVRLNDIVSLMTRHRLKERPWPLDRRPRLESWFGTMHKLREQTFFFLQELSKCWRYAMEL